MRAKERRAHGAREIVMIWREVPKKRNMIYFPLRRYDDLAIEESTGERERANTAKNA